MYVADRESHRVQVFDGNGRYQAQWNNLHRPCAMCLGPKGCPFCYIGELGPGMAVNRNAPNLGPRLSILSREGELLYRIERIGDDNPLNQFIAPHGIAVDSRGDIYVGEVARTVWPQKFSNEPIPDSAMLSPQVRPPSGRNFARWLVRRDPRAYARFCYVVASSGMPGSLYCVPAGGSG